MNRWWSSLFVLAGVVILFGGMLLMEGRRATAANTSAMLDVDNPARQPFQVLCSAAIDGFGHANCTLTTVPAGKRLVIEMVEANLHFGGTGVQNLQVFVGTTVGGASINHGVLPTLAGSVFGDNYVVSQQVRLYADPGTTVSAFTDSNTVTAIPVSFFAISGYLVNLP